MSSPARVGYILRAHGTGSPGDDLFSATRLGPPKLLQIITLPHDDASALALWFMDSLVLLLLAGGVFLTVRRWLAGRALRKVRGPPSAGWLLGKFTVAEKYRTFKDIFPSLRSQPSVERSA